MDAPHAIALVSALTILITLAFVVAMDQYRYPNQTWRGEDDWHADLNELRRATSQKPDEPTALLEGPKE